MAQGNHWWNEPPLWAWVTLVAGLVAIIVMLPIALSRTAPASGPSDEASATPSAPAESSEAAPTDTGGPARILVIGDSYTGGSPDGGQDGTGWPDLIQQRMPGIEVQVAATGDAGYVTASGDPTLFDLVAEADVTDIDVLILFGSRFDAAGIADRVSEAAQGAIASIRDEAPVATLVVIGPAWPGDAAPAGARNNRDVIRAAAEDASVRFIDPLSDEWFTDARGLVGADGVHLTDEGHAYLADRIEPVVQEALDARAATPASDANGG